MKKTYSCPSADFNIEDCSVAVRSGKIFEGLNIIYRGVLQDGLLLKTLKGKRYEEKEN